MRLPRLTMKNDQPPAALAGSTCNSADNQNRLTEGRKIRRIGSMLKIGAAVCAVGVLAGCDTKGWFNQTDISVRSGHPTDSLVVPILTTLDPAAEKGPIDFASATLPRPSDLVSSTNDYTIGRNDLLNISISDLMAPGQESTKVARVSESGNISLPYLGSVHAAGLTEIELEQGIVQAYRDANLIQNSQVSVTVVEARGRTVEILGAVAQPGQYAILDSDFRLLDALVQSKDVTSPLVDYIYIVRKSESQHAAAQATTRPVPNIRTTTAPATPAKTPATAAPDDLAPHSDATDAAQPDAPVVAKISSANHPLSLVADAPVGHDPELISTRAPSSKAAGTARPFEFNGPETTGDVRVIKIPYQGLRHGDLKLNVAIHPRDLVIVQQLSVGEYYLGGHIARPGVYTLSGRLITLKQAVTSGGGFDDLAVPQRTEIIRRIQPDREIFVRVDLERIFAGEQPDLFLRPDDQIMVGTNALAPFLSAFRGAFRLTYGFGFLYDRNFAYTSTNTGGF